MIYRLIPVTLTLSLLAGLTGCAPTTRAEVVGQPLTDHQRHQAYRAVLQELPDTLRRLNPVLRPAVCLDRGIYARPFGAHVEDHDAGWIDRLLSDDLVQAMADHSPSACPEESYWVALANTQLLPGDSVSVPLTIQRIARRAGGQADRETWTAIVTDRGGWRFVRWE